jgi:hypothetical protein
MKIKSVFFIVVVVITMLNSCSYDKWDLPQPDLGDCDTATAVTYTNYVSAVMATNCNIPGCHDNAAPAGFDYTTYASIKAKVDNGTFRTRVIILRDMPDPTTTGPKTLDACTLAKLSKWVNNGAPE